MAGDADSCPDGRLEPPPPLDTGTHGLVLLPEMEPCVRALERAMQGAQRRIHLACYIVEGDAFGAWLEELLVPAVERGVECRLLYDAVGSQASDHRFFERLAARGVETRAYRGLKAMLRGSTFFPRAHGRIFVIDDSAFTGGLAFREEWLPRNRGGRGWHDISLQVAWGPVVLDFERLFDAFWRESVGAYTPVGVDTGDRYPDLELVADGLFHTRLVYDHLRQAIRRARNRIWIENGYFYPPPAMRRELMAAAGRGVQVRVIVPRECNLMLIGQAARAESVEWIEAGIHVFEYHPSMNHAKMAVVDDDLCTIGTFNANLTGVAMATEVNVFVRDRRFVALCAEHYRRDLALSVEVDPELVRRRPLLERARDRLKANVVDLGTYLLGLRDRHPDAERERHADAERDRPTACAPGCEQCRGSR